MLEQKHGMIDGGRYDYLFDGVNGDTETICTAIPERVSDEYGSAEE